MAAAGLLHQVLHDETPTDLIGQLDDYAEKMLAERRARFNAERSDDPMSRSPWSLEQFCGTYRHQGFGRLHVTEAGGHLQFHIESLTNFDGPLVRYSGLGFEYQGDRDAVAWPALATPVSPTGERAWLRFRGGEHGIEAVHWHGWFGGAVFQRCSGAAASDASASSARK